MKIDDKFRKQLIINVGLALVLLFIIFGIILFLNIEHTETIKKEKYTNIEVNENFNIDIYKIEKDRQCEIDGYIYKNDIDKDQQLVSIYVVLKNDEGKFVKIPTYVSYSIDKGWSHFKGIIPIFNKNKLLNQNNDIYILYKIDNSEMLIDCKVNTKELLQYE